MTGGIQLKSVTEGIDAMGEVTEFRPAPPGMPTPGHSAATDIGRGGGPRRSQRASTAACMAANAPLSIPASAVGDCRGAYALSTSAVGKSGSERSGAGLVFAGPWRCWWRCPVWLVSTSLRTSGEHLHHPRRRCCPSSPARTPTALFADHPMGSTCSTARGSLLAVGSHAAVSARWRPTRCADALRRPRPGDWPWWWPPSPEFPYQGVMNPAVTVEWCSWACQHPLGP